MDVPNFNSLSYQERSYVSQWVSLSSPDHGRFMDADGGLQVQAGSWNSGMQNSNSSTGSNVSFVGLGYGNGKLAGLQMPKEEVSSWDDGSPFASPESMSVSMPVPRSPLGVLKTQPVVSRAGGDAKDHIMAERRRREKLSQRFIALSAIVPGLRKTDKASVLGETIKYLKEMEERVKSLEEEAKQKTVHSMVLVKKPQLLPSRDEAPSSEPDTDSFHTSFNDALPEIEARICDKSVLIRILCEKRQGVVEQVLAEVEKLHLTITNSSVLSFGASSLNIIIVAQMNPQFCKTIKEIVMTMFSSLQHSA